MLINIYFYVYFIDYLEYINVFYKKFYRLLKINFIRLFIIKVNYRVFFSNCLN